MPLDKDAPIEFRVGEEEYEAGLQSSGGSANVLKDTILNGEGETIGTFLSSLKLDYFFDDALGICSN